MRNTKFLLPSKFKNAGWWIFGITLVLIILHFAFQSQCDFSVNTIRAFFGMERLGPKETQLTTIFSSSFGPNDDLLLTFIGILLIVAGIFIGFSRNKEDDEFIEQLRYESLILSLYINSGIVLLCLIFVWGFSFLWVMTVNIFSTLYVFIFCFYLRLYLNKRSLRHEKQD
jgi:uncharacterized membrane protein